jgi:hypothetical protein
VGVGGRGRVTNPHPNLAPYRSQEEALSLIRREPPPRQAPRKQEQVANPWSGGEAPDVQTLSLAGDVEQMAAHMDIDDPFTKAMPEHPNPITLTRYP